MRLGTLSTAGAPPWLTVGSLPADPNTLFRSNSLASKSVEQFLKVSPGGDVTAAPRDGLRAWRSAGDSMGTAVVTSCPVQAVGLPYLHAVLKPVVNRIFEEKKYVELDPCKMELSRSRRVWGRVPILVSPTGHLSGHELVVSPQEDLLQGVPVGSPGAREQPGAAAGLPGGHGGCHRGLGGQVPPPDEGGLQAAPQAGGGALPLTAARGGGPCGAGRAAQRWVLSSVLVQEVQYFAISGFLFLRFFAPAVLTPKLFGLQEQHAEPRTGRTLLLLAKVLKGTRTWWGDLGEGWGFGARMRHQGGTGTRRKDVGPRRDRVEGQGPEGEWGHHNGWGHQEGWRPQGR